MFVIPCTPSAVRCLSCHYDLRNLPENRCPECGREFDPNDLSSFDSDERRERAFQKAFGWIMTLYSGAGLILMFVGVLKVVVDKDFDAAVCLGFFFALFGFQFIWATRLLSREKSR